VITEEAAKADLQEHLKKQVREDVWKYLVEDLRVSEYLQDETDLKKLADEYRRLDRLDPRNARSKSIPRELPPDNRSESLADIIANETSKIPEVQAFRKRRLRGQLVAAEEWTVWLRRRAKKERPDKLDAQALKRCVQFSFDVGVDYPGAREGSRWLNPARVIAEPGGVIEDLLNTARIVEERFQPAVDLRRALILVLTGLVWLPRIISEQNENHEYPALTRIKLEIDPRVKPRELQEHYAKLRDRALPSRGRIKDRVMTDKHLQLAAFAAPPWPPWAETLKQWNDDHPEWAYPGTRSGQSNFARDLKSAYERVTGKHADEIRREQAFARLKESFKAGFLREGRSEEEADKMSEIAATGRPLPSVGVAEDQGEV
jgi:hypothetical protein